MEDVSLEVFCIYTDVNILNEFLIQSLKKQNVDCKITTYNGKDSQIGAAEIYNKLIAQSDADVIVCVHQDVSFEDKNAIMDIYNYLKAHPMSIIGAAGVYIDTLQPGSRAVVCGNVVEGNIKEFSRLTPISKPKEVIAVDECMFTFNRKVFECIQLDSETCSGWHFYATDYCYSARNLGIKSYAFPVYIWHKSTGKIEKDFYVQLRRIKKKYKKRESFFITPCIRYNTHIPVLRYEIARKIRCILVKYKNRSM